MAAPSFEKEPAGTSGQTVLLGLDEYDPAGQGVNPDDPVDPPVNEYEPAGTLTHEVEPVTAVYKPAGHGIAAVAPVNAPDKL